MGVITGVRGLLNGVSLFQNFSVTSTANLKELRHAGTGVGGVQRIPGMKDWNGTYQSYGLVPDYWPGDYVSFLGSIDGLVGLSGPCLITQVEITIPVGADDPPTHTGTFRGNGELLRGAAVVSEPSASIPPGSRSLCPLLSDIKLDVPQFQVEENTFNITISLSIEVAEYNDCSTDGILQVVESTWDASVNYDRYVDDFSLLPDEGEVYLTAVPIDAAAVEFYEFQWMRVAELSNMQVNRETGELVSASVSMQKSVFEEIGTGKTPTVGQVIKPDGSVWRPKSQAVFYARRVNLLEQAAEALALRASEGTVDAEVAVRATEQFQRMIEDMRVKGIDLDGMLAKEKSAREFREAAIKQRRKDFIESMRTEQAPVTSQPLE